eukprot:gb/GFBE01023336.1/.p1 GENE.gb/GFBE01023336.1/~~gb/GFBE01023336.1/.p1  ORF type:complete len:640 (+),score=100.98 gb/GFBE01023336.1/:1-1920(+)
MASVGQLASSPMANKVTSITTTTPSSWGTWGRSAVSPQRAAVSPLQPQPNVASMRLAPGSLLSVPSSWQTAASSNHSVLSWSHNPASARSSTSMATTSQVVSSKSYTLPAKHATTTVSGQAYPASAHFTASAASSCQVPVLASGRVTSIAAGSFTAAPAPTAHGSFTAAPALGKMESAATGSVILPARSLSPPPPGSCFNDASSPRVLRWSPPVAGPAPSGLRGSFGQPDCCSPRMVGSTPTAPLPGSPIGGRTGPALAAALLSPPHEGRRGLLAAASSPRAACLTNCHGSCSPPPRMARSPRAGSPQLVTRLPSAPACALGSSPPPVLVSVTPSTALSNAANSLPAERQQPPAPSEDPVMLELQQLARLPQFIPPSFEGTLPVPESPEDSPLRQDVGLGRSHGFDLAWGTATASTIVADEEPAERTAEIVTNPQQDANASPEMRPVSPQFGIRSPTPVVEKDAVVTDTGPGTEESPLSSVCSYSSSENEDEVEDYSRSPRGDMRLLSPGTFVDDLCSPLQPELIFELSPDACTVPAPARLLGGAWPVQQDDVPKLSPRSGTPIETINLTPPVLPDSLETTPVQPEQPSPGRFDWSMASADKVEWLEAASAELPGCGEGNTDAEKLPLPPKRPPAGRKH